MCTAVRLVAVKHCSVGQWSKQVLEVLCRQVAILGLAQGPRHAGVPAGPKAVGDMELSRGQTREAKSSPSKQGWLPHTAGPPTKTCPGSLVAASHPKALRFG